MSDKRQKNQLILAFAQEYRGEAPNGLDEANLKLTVNSEKSAVARPWERKFLGFSFTNAGGTKAADSAESRGPVQGAGAETDVPDTRRKHRADGRTTDRLSAWLDRLLRSMSNAVGIAGS
jgi:hypothetical protein